MPATTGDENPAREGRVLITKTGLILFRLYADETGATHLEDVGYSMATTKHGLLAENVAASELGLKVFTDGPEQPDFGPSPIRRLVVPLAGRSEIEASDGSRRLLEVRTLLLAEDTTGAGHRIHELEQPRLSLYIPLLEKKRAPSGLLW
jgi:hypothetical protein